MAWIGAAIAGGAALIGDISSQSGQQSTNAMNQANMLQQEQWQTQMSDTAMQRRVSDLKAAGLNPLLATGTSGAQVGSVGQPNLQNPDAAFGGMGSQISSAVQLGAQNAQIEATKAQADKARADTATTMAALPYTGDTAKAMLEQMNYKTNEIIASSHALNAQADKAGADARLSGMSGDFQQDFLNLRNQMSALDVQRLKLGMPRLEDDAAWQKAHPILSGWLQSGSIPGVNSVMGSAAKAAEMLP